MRRQTVVLCLDELQVDTVGDATKISDDFGDERFFCCFLRGYFYILDFVWDCPVTFEAPKKRKEFRMNSVSAYLILLSVLVSLQTTAYGRDVKKIDARVAQNLRNYHALVHKRQQLLEKFKGLGFAINDTIIPQCILAKIKLEKSMERRGIKVPGRCTS